MVQLKDIKSQDWSLSLTTPEAVVEGINDIRQCIYIILTTIKGTDPTRPEFGCGIFEWIDKPVNLAIPNMKKEIARAIQLFEPRVKIIRILHAVNEGHLQFRIEWGYGNTTQTSVIAYKTGATLFEAVPQQPGDFSSDFGFDFY